MTDIAIPQDTAKSRLNRAPKTEPLDDVATAGDRIEAFWEKYPDGSILTEVDSREVLTAENLPCSVFTVRAFVRKDAAAERPDATAHATRSAADPGEITAAFPQETAETSAVSRALRNLGILASRKPTAAAETDDPEPAPPRTNAGVAVARRAAGLSQADLAHQMRSAGFPWTQSIVSKVERGRRPVPPKEAVALAHLIGYEDAP